MEIRPTYNVEFWEHHYEIELKNYLELVEKKVLNLKVLKSIDLLSLQEQISIRINKQIKELEIELDTLQGMIHFMEDMKNSYLATSLKMHEIYFERNILLEYENQLQSKHISILKREVKCYQRLLNHKGNE